MGHYRYDCFGHKNSDAESQDSYTEPDDTYMSECEWPRPSGNSSTQTGSPEAALMMITTNATP